MCVLQESIPFAVVGTDKEHQVNGHKVLGRKTKWGIIEGKLAMDAQRWSERRFVASKLWPGTHKWVTAGDQVGGSEMAFL